MSDPRQAPLYNTLNEFDFIVFVQLELEDVPYRVAGQCPPLYDLQTAALSECCDCCL